MERTLKNFLKTALLPLGSTMYIYGGGWDDDDNGAGIDARTMGVSPRWRDFFEKQDENYDFKEYLYERRNGLDCSGYVGWVIYNLMEEGNRRSGYVKQARSMAMDFADRGWGSLTSKDKVTDYHPGDILSGKDHVWISLGQCSDGSVLMLHSSPPGVILSGTVAKNGASYSEALFLAYDVMASFHPWWHRKYPCYLRGASYLTDYDRFRWDLKNGVLTDPDGYDIMSPNQLINHLFRE